jgi:hypothetical protein
MAVSANTFTSTQAVGNREELSDVVDLTQRSDAPIYSMASNDSAKSTFPEWETESLDAPGDNAVSEGSDYSFDDTDPNKRYGNHTQIFRKTGKFSHTQDAVDNAGQSEKALRAKVRKGLALKTDVEYSIVAANASVGGDTRKSGSLSTWAETNVSRGAGGANGGYNDTTKVTTAPTDGTQRAFTKTLLDELLQSAYSTGAKLEHMFLSPYNKGVFASFMSDSNVAQFRYAAKGGKNTIVADAEVYLGPLGKVFVHPNFVMGGEAGLARNVFVLDTKKIKWAWLRKIAEDKDLAKTGSYKKFVLEGEGTLKVMNEKAVGVIADVFGMSATA